jgi:hypothetical protein
MHCARPAIPVNFMRIITCVPKSLTLPQAELAVRRSIEVNPANALDSRTVERTPTGRRGGPRRLALLVGNRWPATGMTLTVQFLDNPSKELRRKILLHMNAWSQSCSIRFVESDNTGMVRIARLDGPPDMAGYWSYVGTQILGIDSDQPTLNLEGFTLKTSEDEFKRVVRHEAGHTLGFEHEHMRSDLVKKIDRRKAIAYFDRTQGWTEKETIEQVLTPLSKKSILGTTESDPLSIMCYEIPAEITKDGQPILGGIDINPNDFQFAAKVYPKTSSQPLHGPTDTVSPVAEETKPPSTEAGPPVRLAGSEDSEAFHLVVMDEFDPENESSRGQGVPSDSASRKESPQFARVFASYGGARVTSSMKLRAGQGEPATAFGRIIGVHERIKRYTNREQGSLPTDDEMIAFGRDLFETLFTGDVRRLYDEARARQQNRKLDLVLTSMIPWIAEKPWEFAYDSGRDSFLATEDIHLVRNVLTAVPATTILPRSGPLRILVASAQPVGLGQLTVEQEVEVIRRGFRPLEDSGLVQVEIMARATPRRIQATLSTGNFTVVHVIGHGTFDETAEKGALYFEDELGHQLPLGQRSVREIFCKRGVSLVFLNSCQSGSGGRHQFNRGVAQSLVSHGLPAVVANQYSVLDTSATSFAQHFYWSLANGMSIGQATCEARIAVNCSLQGEIIDWAIPVVYARDPHMALCVKPETTASSTIAVRIASRKAVQERSFRVAVWDIDNVLPSLEETLKRLNESQSTFGFELAALSVPLDAWDLEQETQTPDGTPYLCADKMAERLRSTPVELRVNLLACITRHWMKDENWLNLYGWWPAKQDPPVVAFSCAGMDDLPPVGPETDRAIANFMVSALAGFLADVDSHEHGAKDCPLAFNANRERSIITGVQAFDKGCRDKLKKALSQEQLAALESLLKPLPE